MPKIHGPVAHKWRFITPRAPWWGGFYERMIKSVKSSLKKTLGVKFLTKSELGTVLIEKESCVNSRPVTYVSKHRHKHRNHYSISISIEQKYH